MSKKPEELTPHILHRFTGSEHWYRGCINRRVLFTGPSTDWGIMNRAIRPVEYVAGWGLVDGMDATFGGDRK